MGLEGTTIMLALAAARKEREEGYQQGNGATFILNLNELEAKLKIKVHISMIMTFLGF